MVTAGLASLSSVVHDEIVVAQLESAEFVDGTGRIFQRRINDMLGRVDLRFVRLIRAEDTAVLPGLSFQDFQKSNRPPLLVFACPHCDDGEAVPFKSKTIADFKRAGGTLNVIADVDVRD